MNKRKNKFFFSSADDLLAAIPQYIRQTDTVMDVGPGLRPMNYFRPKLHILVEAFAEYSNILWHRHSDDKSVMLLQGRAEELLPIFSDNSVDSVMLLDFIEHLPKETGSSVIAEAERIAREQIVVFTPLGFMEQHIEDGEKDAWGLSGGHLQEHLSGWTPDDFGSDWDFYICEQFHTLDWQQQPLSTPHAAFYAVRNFEYKPRSVPRVMSDIRLPLPSEIALNAAQAELTRTREVLAQTQAELADARRVLSHPVVRAQRAVWQRIKFWK